MLNKKSFFILIFSVFLLSGCELLRSARSGDINSSDVSAMFDEGRPSSSEGEPVTVSSQLHKLDNWFKDNLW